MSKNTISINATLDAFFSVADWWQNRLLKTILYSGSATVVSSLCLFALAGAFTSLVFGIFSILLLIPIGLLFLKFDSIKSLKESRDFLLSKLVDARTTEINEPIKKGSVRTKFSSLRNTASLLKNIASYPDTYEHAAGLKDSLLDAISICNPATLTISIASKIYMAFQICVALILSCVVLL